MNTSIFVACFLLLISACNLPKTDARAKTLKIIIPSKIRYVHHHHTHVLVMKDKKPYRGPDAKYHHLHFYNPSGRKGKDSNHYFIPFIPPQAEDEVDEETSPIYAVTTSKRGRYPHADNYGSVSTGQQPPVYQEPEYYSSSKKYRVYSRSDIPQPEYYKVGPITSLEPNDSKRLLVVEKNPGDYEHSKELSQSYEPEHVALYQDEPRFYPVEDFFSNKRIRHALTLT